LARTRDAIKERTVLERETRRRHKTIILNEGKNVIGTDAFCELLNLKTVIMNKSKTFERYSECSSAVTIVSHPDEFRRSCLPLQRRRRHTTKIVYEEVTALYS